MGKLIVLALLVGIAIWLIRRALQPPRSGEASKSASSPVGELVRCAHCGVHLPRSEARRAGELLYCSEEHARLGPGTR